MRPDKVTINNLVIILVLALLLVQELVAVGRDPA